MQENTKSGFAGFVKKFAKHRLAMIALVIILLEVLVVLILPVALNLDPYGLKKGNQPPSAEFIFGTDDVGRDLFARVLHGGRVSLFVGIASAMISVVIGIPLGLIAGYWGGWPGALIMRAADIFMSFPSMVLILVLVTIIGPSIATVTIVIGVLGWTNPAKLIYGNVLSVRNKDYVEAARAIGTGNFKIISKYVLPNVMAPVWVSLAFRASNAILTESSLSFLGAGVQAPQASWGNIIHAAQNLLVLTTKPWVWLPPGILLLITVICINLVGEGLRDALDPKMKR